MFSYFNTEASQGLDAFIAINESNLPKLQKLIEANPKLLTITDHCNPKLDTLLGGYWAIFEGQYGRYEKNTLLNFALSMERLDIAVYLIEMIIQHNFLDILTQENDHRISPIEMLYMVNGKCSQYYDSKGELKTARVLSDEERKQCKVLALQLLDLLLPHTQDQQRTLSRLVCNANNHRLLPLPELTLACILKCKNRQTKINAIQNYLDNLKSSEVWKFPKKEAEKYMDELKTLSEEKWKENHQQQAKKFKKKSIAITALTEDFEQMKKIDQHVTSEYATHALFIALILQAGLESELASAVRSDFWHAGERGMIRTGIIAKDPKKTSFISEFLKDFPKELSDLPAEDLAHLQFIVAHVFRGWTPYSNGARELKCPQVLANKIGLPNALKLVNNYKEPEDINRYTEGTNPEALSFKTPFTINKTPLKPQDLFLRQFTFHGQHANAPFRGAKSCTSICLVTAARLLNMDNAEFFSVFHPILSTETTQQTATTILSSCVETGYILHAKIAGSFLKMFTRRDVQDLNETIEGLSTNIGGVKNLKYIENENVHLANGTKPPEDAPHNLEEYINQYANHAVTPNGLFFIITANNHTTALFTRTDDKNATYYYVLDSIETLFTGKLSVFASFKQMDLFLQNKWKDHKEPYISASTFTNNARFENKFIESRTTTPLESKGETPQQDRALSTLKCLCEYMNSPFEKDGKTKIARAKAYLHLLTQAETEDEKSLVIYSLLQNTKDPELRRAVTLKMGYMTSLDDNDTNKALQHCKNDLDPLCQRSGIDDKALKQLVQNINTNADAGKAIVLRELFSVSSSPRSGF